MLRYRISHRILKRTASFAERREREGGSVSKLGVSDGKVRCELDSGMEETQVSQSLYRSSSSSAVYASIVRIKYDAVGADGVHVYSGATSSCSQSNPPLLLIFYQSSLVFPAVPTERSKDPRVVFQASKRLSPLSSSFLIYPCLLALSSSRSRSPPFFYALPISIYLILELSTGQLTHIHSKGIQTDTPRTEKKEGRNRVAFDPKKIRSRT